MMDLVGIAALITALTGAFSLIISLYLIYRVSRVQETTDHIQHLTNSNFSKMQSLLGQAIRSNEASAARDRQREIDRDTEKES